MNIAELWLKVFSSIFFFDTLNILLYKFSLIWLVVLTYFVFKSIFKACSFSDFFLSLSVLSRKITDFSMLFCILLLA